MALIYYTALGAKALIGERRLSAWLAC